MEANRVKQAEIPTQYLTTPFASNLGIRTTSEMRCERPDGTVPPGSPSDTVESVPRCERYKRDTVTWVQAKGTGQDAKE